MMEVVPLLDLELPGGTVSPRVVRSTSSRAILLSLEPGQALGEHEVREEAWLLVLDGAVRLELPDAGATDVRAGTMVVFQPHERHAARSESGARLLLVLTPWPAADHAGPGADNPGEDDADAPLGDLFEPTAELEGSGDLGEEVAAAARQAVRQDGG